MSLIRPDLVGRRVALEPLRDRHLDDLHTIATMPGVIDGWPCFGRELTPAELRQSIWALGGLQFAVRRRDTEAVIGVVQGLHPDLDQGVVELGFFIEPELWLRGWPLEAIVVALEYLFGDWDFRKVYLRTRASDAEKLGVAGRWMTEEARHPDHHIAPDGTAEDVVVLSISRDDWDSDLAARILGRPTTGRVHIP
jgi:RimJ/RimL family protein N-acetyltransferase